MVEIEKVIKSNNKYDLKIFDKERIDKIEEEYQRVNKK